MKPALFVLALFLMSAPQSSAGPPSGKIGRAASEWLNQRDGARWTALPDEWERDDWDWVDSAPGGAADGSKSLLKAVLASALLPGLGERYVGHSRRASIFHAAEGAIWTSFTTFRIQGALRRDRYQEFAEVRGGANRDGSDDYFEHIGLWISLEEWHEIVRRDARLRFPDDPAAQQEFFSENQRYGAGLAWEWPDDETRVRYRQLRSQSERAFRNGRLAVGLAIVNRLASMVDALALARNHNSERAEGARLEFRISPEVAGGEMVLGPVVSTRY